MLYLFLNPFLFVSRCIFFCRKKTFFDQQPAHTDQIFFLEKNYNDFFQFSDRDLEMVIPFPPSPLREAHLQKKSEFLSILSPIDKDVSWFYKTLSILGKPGGLYSDLLQSDEILSRFSFLVLDIHTLSSFVVKRLLIRSQNNEAGLEVENGIEQLYKHVYFDVLKGVEQSIMNHLRRHHSQITVRPLKEVFILEEESQCYYAHFKIHHPKAPLPALIGSIPWVLALSLVRTRRVFLKAGIVYFCYMDAPNLAKDAWKIGMDYWRRYEASDLLEQAAKYTYIDVRNAASLPFSFESAHLEEICIQNKKHISPAPPPAASRTLIQLPNTPSGSFLTDYKPIMPPCIAAIVDKHLIEGSHMQYSDRLTFFSWCYRAGAPLESVVDFWSNMLQNDSNVDRHKAKSLVVNLQGIYKSLAQKSSNYGFKSCEAMRKDSRCPIQPTSSSSNIVDIEDLKSECRRMCSAPASFKFWSPMSATKTLSQNKRRK